MSLLFLAVFYVLNPFPIIFGFKPIGVLSVSFLLGIGTSNLGYYYIYFSILYFYLFYFGDY